VGLTRREEKLKVKTVRNRKKENPREDTQRLCRWKKWYSQSGWGYAPKKRGSESRGVTVERRKNGGERRVFPEWNHVEKKSEMA